MIVSGFDFRDWVSNYNPDVVQGKDCGDACNRTGLFYACAAIIEGREKWQRLWLGAADKFEVGGVLYRGLDPGTWPATSTENCSRDQTTNFLSACIIMRDFARLERIRAQWKKRHFFGQNVYKNWGHAPNVHPTAIKDGYPQWTVKDAKIPDFCTPSLWRLMNSPNAFQWTLEMVDLSFKADVPLALKTFDGFTQLGPTILACNEFRPTRMSRWALDEVMGNYPIVKNQLEAYFQADSNGIPMMPALLLKALNTLYWSMK